MLIESQSYIHHGAPSRFCENTLQTNPKWTADEPTQGNFSLSSCFINLLSTYTCILIIFLHPPPYIITYIPTYKYLITHFIRPHEANQFYFFSVREREI